VVIADLRVNGVSHGPHPFFLKLRESAGGKLVQGITIEDMGCRHTNTHARTAPTLFRPHPPSPSRTKPLVPVPVPVPPSGPRTRCTHWRARVEPEPAGLSHRETYRRPEQQWAAGKHYSVGCACACACASLWGVCAHSFKTVANDLDNARFWFDHVRLPKSALLNKFGDIRDDKCVARGRVRCSSLVLEYSGLRHSKAECARLQGTVDYSGRVSTLKYRSVP
jgi:hypothetical protein